VSISIPPRSDARNSEDHHRGTRNSSYVRLIIYLCRADGLTELAGDAALLTIGVAAQGMLTTETGTDMALLERVVNEHLNTIIGDNQWQGNSSAPT